MILIIGAPLLTFVLVFLMLGSKLKVYDDRCITLAFGSAVCVTLCISLVFIIIPFESPETPEKISENVLCYMENGKYYDYNSRQFLIQTDDGSKELVADNSDVFKVNYIKDGSEPRVEVYKTPYKVTLWWIYLHGKTTTEIYIPDPSK